MGSGRGLGAVRGVVNDAVRALIAGIIEVVGWGCGVALALRAARQERGQARLRRRFGVTETTPIQRWGPALAAAITSAAARAGVELASTSGSSAAPKCIPYSPARLRAARWVFIDAFTRAAVAYRWRRPSLFVFAGSDDDGSLTSKLVRERGPVGRLALLQAPYRAFADPALADLVEQHGLTAARALVLALANPGVLYATNPSTLAAFLDDLAPAWPALRALARRCLAPLDPALARLGRRLRARGARQRLEAIAASPRPLPLATIAPAVSAYLTWTGGYVAPFLARVRHHLPPPAYQLVPMYSMSTETIATVPDFSLVPPAFLPLAPGVLAEFLPADAPDDPAHLLDARALTPGQAYSLVVSDGHGLRRYQTEDLFECRGFHRGLPDLAFLRRQGLAHSFTGEKLTGDEVAAALAGLRATAALPVDLHLTLVPRAEPTPHYQLCLVTTAPPPALSLARLAEAADQRLAAGNPEYRAKRASGRLGPIHAAVLTPTALAALVGKGNDLAREAPAQFKLLPLTLPRRPAR